MNSLDIAQKQLDNFYTMILSNRQIQLAVRKWFITIWVALIGAVITKQISRSSLSFLFLVMLAIVLFWWLEAIQLTFIVLDERKAKRIEEYLVSFRSNQNLPIDAFYVSSYGNDSYFAKIREYFKSFFLRESVCLFYIAISITTVIFWKILK
jgi:hypothetical protein